MERPYNVEGTLMEQYLRREHIGCEAEVPETLEKKEAEKREKFFSSGGRWTGGPAD